MPRTDAEIFASLDQLAADANPTLKLLCMILTMALKDRVRHLSFVLKKGSVHWAGGPEGIADPHWRFYLLGDNFFYIPPPHHLFPRISRALKVLRQVARERDLLGRFAYHEYTRPADGPYELRWDIRFSSDELERRLPEELELLLRATLEPVRFALERMTDAEDQLPPETIS